MGLGGSMDTTIIMRGSLVWNSYWENLSWSNFHQGPVAMFFFLIVASALIIWDQTRRSRLLAEKEQSIVDAFDEAHEIAAFYFTQASFLIDGDHAMKEKRDGMDVRDVYKEALFQYRLGKTSANPDEVKTE